MFSVNRYFGYPATLFGISKTVETYEEAISLQNLSPVGLIQQGGYLHANTVHSTFVLGFLMNFASYWLLCSVLYFFWILSFSTKTTALGNGREYPY